MRHRSSLPVCLAGYIVAMMFGSSSCGSSSDVTTVQDLRSTYYRRTCQVLITCPNPLSSLVTLYGDDLDRCVELFERSRFASIEDLVSKVARGSIAFDGAAFDACWENALATCDGSGGGLCEKAFVGSVSVAGPCNVDLDCEPSAYCATSNGTTCPGACAARKPPGTTCSSDEECAAGDGTADCASDPTSNARVCFQRVTKAAALGAKCGSAIEGARAVCSKGLWCKTDLPFPFGDAGTCIEPLAEGAACEGFDVCARDTTCTATTSDGPRQCRRVRIGTNVGETCGDATATLCSPLDGLTCSSGKCAQVDGSAGAACGDGAFISCDAGLTCIDQTCAAPRAADQPCGDDRDCASGSCDAASGRCRAAYCD
jgi:hypothetical protein